MRSPRRRFPLVTAVALLTAAAAFAATPAVSGEVPEIAYRLPTGEQWLAHFVRDVLPYWTSPEALGEPIGHFPTFRYSDGAPIAAGELLRPEYRGISDAPWLAPRLDRTYTRMISRQAFVLGVAYHLTGDGRYLAWAKAAVDHVLGDLADGDGSFCSWIEDGECRPPVLKAHLWKNGYHSAEHALVGYVTGNALRREPVTLYFAPAAGKEPPAFYPYLFDGRVETVRRLPLPRLPGHDQLEARFTDVQ